jgi:hypothetical protein
VEAEVHVALLANAEAVALARRLDRLVGDRGDATGDAISVVGREGALLDGHEARRYTVGDRALSLRFFAIPRQIAVPTPAGVLGGGTVRLGNEGFNLVLRYVSGAKSPIWERLAAEREPDPEALAGDLNRLTELLAAVETGMRGGTIEPLTDEHLRAMIERLVA